MATASKRTLLVATVAGLAALMHASDGAAASWVPAGPVRTVELSGQRAVWTTGRKGGGFDLYTATSGPARKLRTFRTSVPRSAYAASLVAGVAATESRIWIEITRVVVERDPQAGSVSPTNRFLTGPLTGPYEEFERCDEPLFPGRGGLDVTETVLAFSRCDGSAEIRDMAKGGSTAIVGSNVDGIRAAGRYVAWLEGPPPGGSRDAPEAIVVYDAVKAVVAYRIEAADAPPRTYGLALDADGSVAFQFDPDPNDTRAQTRVGWASLQEPSFHDAGLRARAGYSLRMVGGELMLIRSLQASGVSRRTELAVGRLNGRLRVLARNTVGFNFDFDGKRILYVKRTCHGHLITRVQLATIRKPLAAARCRRP